jgi:hypothetical protein
MISIFSSQALRKEVRLKAMREKEEKMSMEIPIMAMVVRLGRRFPFIFWNARRITKRKKKSICFPPPHP